MVGGGDERNGKEIKMFFRIKKNYYFNDIGKN
jgi:hypothetical protein